MLEALLFLVALVLMTVVGHLLWLLCAAVVRAITGAEPDEKPVRARAGEEEVATAERLIRSLMARREIDSDVGHEVLDALASRRPSARRAPPTTKTALEELETLLAEAPRDLAPSRRARALSLVRSLEGDQWQQLPAEALWNLARLLRLAGLATRALGVYRHLVQARQSYVGRAAVALEAGEFALREDRPADEARWFLEEALASSPEADLAQRARAILAALKARAQAEQELAVVELIEEPTPVETALAAPVVAEVAPPPVPVAPPVAELPVAPVPARETPAVEPPAPVIEPERPVRRRRVPVVEEEPVVPTPPRRTWTETFAGFMEERNILWGELVGGLLIVGCSIALVVWLWKRLEQYPYFPVAVFGAITLAMFGAGNYTFHRWRLRTTSLGLLVIAMLLVPLNLLVLAGLGRDQGIALLHLGASVVALGGAALVIYGAGKAVASPGHNWLTLAVVAGAGSMLLAPLLIGPADSPVWLLGLSVVPVALQGTAVWKRLRLTPDDQPLDRPVVLSLMLFLGVACFAVAVALAFLLALGTEMRVDGHPLAIPLAVAGVPVCLTGLLVQRRCQGQASGLVAVGLGVTLAGVAVMLGAVALAWPDPLPLLVVCLVNATALTWLAFHHRLPWAHHFTLPCLVLAAALLSQLLTGAVPLFDPIRGDMLLGRLFSSGSVAAVVVLVPLLTAASEWLSRRQGYEGHPWALGRNALAVAALTLPLALRDWDGAPGRLAWVYALCGLTTLAGNLRWQRRWLSDLGQVLLLVATLGALHAFLPGRYEWWGLVLMAEAVLLAAAALQPRADLAILSAPCQWTAHTIVALAAGFVALALPGDPTHGVAASASLLAAMAFLLAAWGHGRPAGGHFAALSLWVGLYLFLVDDLPDGMIAHPWPLSLLAVATALAAVGWLFRWRGGDRVQTVYGLSLGQAGEVQALLVPATLAWTAWGEWWVAGLHLLWTAALWLNSAWRRNSAAWFAAFQACVYAAVYCLAGGWIEHQGWSSGDPRALQAWGIALAGLSLFWVGLRLLTRGSERGRLLLDSPEVTVDRVVLGVLIGLQLLIGVVNLEVGRELTSQPALGLSLNAARGNAVPMLGWGVWVLLGLLGTTLLVSLWDRRRDVAAVGLALVALSVAVWGSHHFIEANASASALRWGLALVFLACSLPLWGREALARWATGLGIDANVNWPLARSLRVLLLVGALVPVLLLSCRVAQLGFAGITPAGPGPETIFARLGWVANNIVPLALLCLGLVGHAVRERSAGYAFWAGQLANVSLIAGYALAVVTGGGVIDLAVGIRLLQLATLGAGLWGLVWMLARPWVYAWREEGGEAQAGLLMTVQLGLAAAGQLVLCLIGLGYLVSPLLLDPVPLGELGSPLGWAALLAVAAMPVVRARQGNETLSWHGVGAFAVGALVLLSCSLGSAWPEWGPRTLMLGCAALAVLGSLGRFVEGRPAWLLGTFPPANLAVAWVVPLQVMALLLGLQSAGEYDQPLWGAGAIAGGSLAGVLVGTWRREEAWALVSGLGANLAASLVVWHFGRVGGSHELRIWLVQVNLATSAAVSLCWRFGQKHLCREEGGLLLGIQTWPVVAGHTFFLLLPLAAIVVEPGQTLASALHQTGAWGGWATLVLVTSAAFAYTRRWLPEAWPHAVGLGGLWVGVLAAVVADTWPSIVWPAYHTLMVGWGLIGLAFLVVCCWTRPALTGWVQGMALALALLAVHVSRTDPVRPWLTSGAALLVAVLFGGLVPLVKQHRHVHASGLALVLAGVLWWLPLGPQTMTGLELTVAASLAAGAILWLGLAWPLRRTGFDLRDGWAPYPYVASLAAVALVGVVTAQRWLHFSLSAERLPLDGLELLTLGGVTLSLLAALRDRNGWFAVLGLYALTLCCVFLGVEQYATSVRQLHQHSTLALACFLLACSLLSWLRHQAGSWLPAGFAEQRYHWFTPAQLGLAFGVIAPSLPLALGGPTLTDRLVAPLAVAVLVLAGLAMLFRPRTALSQRLVSHGTLGVALLALSEAGWAFIEPGAPVLMLRRTAVLLGAVIGSALVYRGLDRLLSESAWKQATHRFGNGLPFVGWGLLPVLLAMEVTGYRAADRVTGLGGAEVAVVVVAIVAMIALAVRWALVPQLDPLGTRIDADGTVQGRTLYVYLAELFLVGLFLHVRLNVPWLFSGKMARYWPVAVMLLAYLGTGLGELFHRRGQHVLATPLRRTGLFLPLLPLLAFWVRPPAFLLPLAEERAPGLVPMLKYLHDLPFAFDRYAFLWLMLGGLYLGLSIYRRSLRYALYAALAANVAFWCLLGHFDLSFLVHPQMWLIPLALILLVTEHLSREHLSKETSLSLRYGSLVMIYVSSTADLFIAGLGNSVWLPVVLAVLCVLGVLAGILLRVRAFLFVGVSFLCLDLFAMIWHAAADRQQTWVWYVSGIVLGSLILAIFAVFEKRRDDVLHVLDQIRTWEA